MFSAGVERFVGRLVVIEAAVGKETKEREAWYEKPLSFIEMGAGVSAAVRQKLTH